MANDSDKKRKLDDDNESLLKALESIKSLLATSEDKLNKARESIDQASSYAIRDNKEIPVLDDIVVPGKTAGAPEQKTVETEPTIPEEQASEETPVTPLPELSAESLAILKMELENEMREKLHAFTQQLELELQQKIAGYIEQINKHHPDR